MAIFSATKVTAQGHALLAKVLAGETKFNFDIVQAGDGEFDGDVLELTELVNHRLDGRIVGVREMGTFTELECIITNQNLTEFMQFREFGIRADDPDLGSILFAYANAGDNGSPMGPFNGVWLHEERFTVRVYTANATNITATIVQSYFATEIVFDNTGSGLSAENVQDAIRELAQLLNTHIDETVFANEPHGIRYNQETGAIEVYNGSDWVQASPGGGGNKGSATLGTARFGSARFGQR